MNVLFKMAIISGVESVVRLHITRGEDVNAQDSAGMSPLMIAAARGHGNICRLLLKAGSNPLLLNNDEKDALALSRMHKGKESEEVLQEYIEKLQRQEPLMDPSSTVVPASTALLQKNYKDFPDEPGLDISMWEEETEIMSQSWPRRSKNGFGDLSRRVKSPKRSSSRSQFFSLVAE